MTNGTVEGSNGSQVRGAIIGFKKQVAHSSLYQNFDEVGLPENEKLKTTSSTSNCLHGKHACSFQKLF